MKGFACDSHDLEQQRPKLLTESRRVSCAPSNVGLATSSQPASPPSRLGSVLICLRSATEPQQSGSGPGGPSGSRETRPGVAGGERRLPLPSLEALLGSAAAGGRPPAPRRGASSPEGFARRLNHAGRRRSPAGPPPPISPPPRGWNGWSPWRPLENRGSDRGGGDPAEGAPGLARAGGAFLRGAPPARPGPALLEARRVEANLQRPSGARSRARRSSPAVSVAEAASPPLPMP
ncbi:putative cuticle collagen 80 [Eublepharis macularius]|uniref:Cuticle collagen 80 n=1 Tax=Eublepharis macularius TaxID=481883 RepID=A0AA97K8K2_EUBMA|nr:putative cuticle collagen 80 [Eublepharis macularius]